MNDRLKSKVALVTGSSKGIGKASVKMFAMEGAKVVVNSSGRNSEEGKAVVDEINKAGGTAVYCQADILKHEDIKKLVEFTINELGRIDILMNNVFTGGWGKAVEYEEREWDIVMNSSIKASWLASKYAIPNMIENGGGSIINVSSVHGLVAGGDCISYSTAKAGLINMSRQIVFDYGKFNIRANTLCPARIMTEKFQERLQNDPAEKRIQKYCYPLGRAGTLDECAYAALFLASDEASFVAGATLVVDGGMTTQMHDSMYPRIEKEISKELAEKGIIWPLD